MTCSNLTGDYRAISQAPSTAGVAPAAPISNYDRIQLVIGDIKSTLHPRVSSCLRALYVQQASDAQLQTSFTALLEQKNSLAKVFWTAVQAMEDEESCYESSGSSCGIREFFVRGFNDTMNPAVIELGKLYLNLKIKGLKEQLAHLRALSSEYQVAQGSGSPAEDLAIKMAEIQRISQEIHAEFCKIPKEFCSYKLIPSTGCCLKLQQLKNTFIRLQSSLITEPTVQSMSPPPEFFKNPKVLELGSFISGIKEVEAQIARHDILTKELTKTGTLLDREAPFEDFTDPVTRSGSLKQICISEDAKKEQTTDKEGREHIRRNLSKELEMHVEAFTECLETLPTKFIEGLAKELSAPRSRDATSIGSRCAQALSQVLVTYPEFKPGPSDTLVRFGALFSR